MSKFSGLNHYELLQVKYNASSFEIRNAYKNLLETYSEDSLATYSLFTEEERKAILSIIENAFLTLIDNDKRTAYDRKLVESDEIPASFLGARESRKAIPIFQHGRPRDRSEFLSQLMKRSKEKKVMELLNCIAGAECISGDDLRRLREALGIELEEIFEVTKISPTVIKAIERNDFAKLPPGIYLRSFLGSYAEVLQLDGKKTVNGYLNNMQQDKG
jgi:DnaJ-class molecular chaperone